MKFPYNIATTKTNFFGNVLMYICILYCTFKVVIKSIYILCKSDKIMLTQFALNMLCHNRHLVTSKLGISTYPVSNEP